VKAWVGVPLLLTIAWSPPAARAVCTPSTLGRDAPTALILSGGGAKGAYEAGAVALFAERGLSIQLVAGSSAGALNAAMVAAGRADHLERMWRGIRREHVYSHRASVFFAGLLPGWLTLLALDGASALLDPQPLRELITASLDLERIRSSPVRLLVTATDLARREQRAFDNRTVTVDALVASTAIPGAFPAVAVDGALLVDGGLIARAPILEALEAAPATVRRAVVVMSYAPDERGAAPTTIRRTLEETVETALLHQIRRDIELARLKHPGVDVQVLTPSAALKLRPLEFDPDGVARVLDLGRADATACLRAWGE
jgi:NTE family protein